MDLPGEVLDAAMGLGREQREELVRLLLLSLEPEGLERDPGYEEAWAAEIEERLRRFESGETVAIPLEEAMERIRPRARKATTP